MILTKTINNSVPYYRNPKRFAPSSRRVGERGKCSQGTKILRISIRNVFKEVWKRLYARSFFPEKNDPT